MTGDKKDVTKNYIALLARTTTSHLGQERIYEFDKSEVRSLSLNKALNLTLWEKLYSDLSTLGLEPPQALLYLLQAAPSYEHAAQILNIKADLQGTAAHDQRPLTPRQLAEVSQLMVARKALNAALLLASTHCPTKEVPALWRRAKLDPATPFFIEALLAMVKDYKLLTPAQVAAALAKREPAGNVPHYLRILTQILNLRPEVIPELMNHPLAYDFARSLSRARPLNDPVLTQLLEAVEESEQLQSGERLRMHELILENQVNLHHFLDKSKDEFKRSLKNAIPEDSPKEQELFINATLTPTLDSLGPDGWDVLLNLANGWKGTLPELLQASAGASIR